jgi:acetylornithine deacetylase
MVDALHDQIIDAVDQGAERTVLLLQDLLRTPSVNPWFGDPAHLSGEGAVQNLYIRLLKELGADEIAVWEPNARDLAHRSDGPGYRPERDFSGRPNVVARFRGSDPTAPALMIQGHCDVVSVGSGWTQDPFGGTRSNGKIYGRGAIDMKGGMAAALGAIAALRAAGLTLKADLLIASVVDEETAGMGTLALVERGHIARAGTIIPEPTNLNIAPLCRGILWGEVVVHGRSGHIELETTPWEEGGAVDAISYAHRLLDAIAERNRQWEQDPIKNHKYLPIPCQIKVAQIEAGEYPTTYASSCKITFNAQYLPIQKDKNGLGSIVKTELEEFFNEFIEGDQWFAEHPPTVTWLVDADCGETSDTEPIVTETLAIAREIGLESQLQGCMAHTDMGLMIDAGSPTINFGPGHMGIAHQADEYIFEEDLKNATKVFALTIREFCG